MHNVTTNSVHVGLIKEPGNFKFASQQEFENQEKEIPFSYN